jgi:uncharacterized repeat protein (TIGR03803 family)
MHGAQVTLSVAVVALMTAGAGFLGIPPAASAAGGEQVLYSFGPDGAGPLAGVSVGPGGVLYGTTVFGGQHGDGSVFTLTPVGSGYREKVVFSFGGRDGSKPGGNVTADARGDLFGDTVVGGAGGDGTVFELVPSGSGYTQKVLYSFTGAGGSQPIGTPVLDASGDVYGVTQFGGSGDQGVVFELAGAAGRYTERVLHSFAADAGQPQAGLARASDGTLYGTLYGFGAVNTYGSVFHLKLGPDGPVYRDLYNFRGGTDGANPFAALTVDNATGVIYGTTQYGSAGGTVFSLSPSGSGYTERVLYGFTSSRDGFGPQGPVLIGSGGDLYGTAALGGAGCSGTGCGTVFELEPGRSGYAFRLLYRFAGPPDGAEPSSGLAAGPGGRLLGTTRSGGTERTCSDGGPGGVTGCGTVYQITP